MNSEIETIEWPNGADFHPETLYRWELYKDELAAIAAKWQQARKAAVNDQSKAIISISSSKL